MLESRVCMGPGLKLATSTEWRSSKGQMPHDRASYKVGIHDVCIVMNVMWEVGIKGKERWVSFYETASFHFPSHIAQFLVRTESHQSEGKWAKHSLSYYPLKAICGSLIYI